MTSFLRVVWCVAVSLIALVLFRVVDTGLYSVLPASLAVLADIRITSFIVIAVACLATPSARAFLAAPQRRPGASVSLLCVIVLCVAFALPALSGVGVVSLPRWQDRLAFHLIGVVNEELLCRGLVLGAAIAAFRVSASRFRHPAVVATTIVFALMHAQYHGFAPGPALVAQLLWTLPLGLACSALAFETRSLWPAVALHLANNALVGLAELTLRT